MMWAYQTLDFISTLTEAVSLYLFCSWLCKKPRFSAFTNKCILMGIYFLTVYAMTWFTELGAYKIPVLIIAGIVLTKICYADSLVTCIVSYEVYLISIPMMTEGIGMLIGYTIYQDDMLVLIRGNSLMRWEIYVATLLVRVCVLCLSYLIYRNFAYQPNNNDFIVLSTVFVISLTFFASDVYMHLNLGALEDRLHYIVGTILPAATIVIFLYIKNTMYLREQGQKDKMQIAQLQQQFAYYQEKLKDEEKVRSVYHDMKNHLLVLQGKINSLETAEMVEKLQSQVEMYEDYVHTGSDILDIILKEKSETAREKHIALSVTADLNGMDFIEPLDISTIFGNGLDNAIEASEKLPQEQRAILMKAGKVQNFFSLLIENNCLQENGNIKSRTTKQDGFLHGFGISNMRKAAEKYGGQLTTKCENGKFTLKILIPIP